MKNKHVFNKRQTRSFSKWLRQLYITVAFTCFKDLMFSITISIATTKVTSLIR